jgi:hypothetical protein
VAFLIAVLLAVLGGDHTAPALAPACAHHARIVLGATDATSFTAPNGAAGCRLRAADREAIVMLDSAPQAYTRMEREQVEFWQNVEWSHKAARASPRPVGDLGLGGYWFPVQSRLLTTDGVRLITVKVKSWPTADPAARRLLATRLARVYLGPPRKPPGY